MNAVRDVDVMILGGGPAGSTAATLLARAGIACTLLEGGHRPRPHVGESLLPHNLPLLDQLGVHEKVRQLPHTRKKEGASFLTRGGERHVVYWFDQALPPAMPHAYQVRREEFDAVLLDSARASGAEVLEKWQAVAPIWEGDRLAGVSARSPAGSNVTFFARAILDATGESSFLAGRMGWRFPYPMHRKMAAVADFRDVWLPAGREAGNTASVLTEGGWFWLIPLADDSVSLGVVLDVERWSQGAVSPEGPFAAAVEATPEVERRLAGAQRLSPLQVFENFSHRVMRVAGDGFCLVGDAAGFLDPIFSTGVFIATTTAASAADDIVEALGRRARVEASDFGATVALTRSLHRLFSSLARAYYDPHFLAFFLDPSPALGFSAAFSSLLAGDVLRPGRWRRTGRYRIIRVLSHLQEWGARWGRPLVAPLQITTAGRKR